MTIGDRLPATILAGLLTLVVGGPARAEEPPDLVIRHARVLTLDDRDTVAEAVAVRGDRIVAVGPDAAIAALVGPETRVLDAGGRTLLPGLYDSHVHPLGAAHSEADHPIPAFRSLADIRAYLAERVKAQPAGSWIVVRYAFPTRLDEGRLPTRAELDAIAPEHPVLHQAGPAGVANTKALALSGITRDTPDPPAGQVVRDPATGEPTGLLRNAYSLLKDLPKDAYGDAGLPATERVVELLRLYNARGITSIGDRGASATAIAVYRDLRDRNQLTVRVNATRILSPPFGDRVQIAGAIRALGADDARGEPGGPTGAGDHWVRIGPLKVFLDGGMLNGTALMRAPWGVGPTYQITEPEYRGLRFVPADALALIAEEAARRGWRMTAHCAGEAGIDALLTAYEAADRAIGIRGQRWLITHANFARPDDLRRAAALGVGADLQPAWLWEDTRTLTAVLGPERMRWFHPYRDWLDAGLTIGGGSDHMIRLDPMAATNPWDPWLGIEVAVTRRARDGRVHQPEQRLTRAEALRFYTVWNARLHGEEAQKGTVEPGKLADLILVDRDPLGCPETDLRATRVLWTIVGGTMVFSDEPPDGPARPR